MFNKKLFLLVFIFLFLVGNVNAIREITEEEQNNLFTITGFNEDIYSVYKSHNDDSCSDKYDSKCAGNYEGVAVIYENDIDDEFISCMKIAYSWDDAYNPDCLVFYEDDALSNQDDDIIDCFINSGGEECKEDREPTCDDSGALCDWDFDCCGDLTCVWQGVIGVSRCGNVECLTGDTKCEGTDYFNCENSRWYNKGKVIGQCGTGSGEDGSEGAVEGVSVIYNIDPKRSRVNPGDTLDVEFSIINPEQFADQNLKIEVGIYTKSYCQKANLFSVYGRGGFGVHLIDSCGGEDFVDSLRIDNLNGNGGDKTFILKPKVPNPDSEFQDRSSNWNGFGEYCVVALHYKECGQDFLSYKSKLITITEAPLITHGVCVGQTLVQKEGLCPTSSCPSTQSDCSNTGGETGGDGEIISDLGCEIPYLVPATIDITIFPGETVIPFFGDLLGKKVCSNSHTKSEYKTITDKEISNSICEIDGNCKPIYSDKEYKVNCVNQQTAGIDKGWIGGLVKEIFQREETGLCLITPPTKDITKLATEEAFQIGGYSIPWWGVIVGIIILFFLVGGRR